MVVIEVLIIVAQIELYFQLSKVLNGRHILIAVTTTIPIAAVIEQMTTQPFITIVRVSMTVI